MKAIGAGRKETIPLSTERITMTLRAALFAFCAGGLLVCPQELSAQTAPERKPHIPLEKSIGQAKPEVVPSLFVLNSRGASLKDGKLVLTGISPNAIVFADRPVRAAGHDLTTRIVEDWGNGSDNFAKDPPNATVSGFKKDGSSVIDAVVVLKSPKLEDDKLTFDVDILEGDLVGADGPASVFIDIIGRPFTPLSFAGVARRTAWRGAFYRGAAFAGAAAVAGAAAYPYYAPRCGYYPYPPCY
ncbi:hypothetical protein OZ411_18920 [Bradyrhizobium sp. Arg237L]|uniref:hypothetical protein n=1 Tax=Bradyrhizobium sp. Arg237L TaxID=3003352 RepID=UPI00249E6D28|nr:hypothetical protein [Bradyrhizobium sp. Arg237L]MDI4234881.1 hypothetical protein [Bradyrhizobium sp. Arg237L]